MTTTTVANKTAEVKSPLAMTVANKTQVKGNGKMTREQELLAKIADLEAKTARLEAQRKSTEKAMSLKISAKGGVSVYGLGRFPVTLYASQWDRLLEFLPSVIAFLADHREELKTDKADDRFDASSAEAAEAFLAKNS